MPPPGFKPQIHSSKHMQQMAYQCATVLGLSLNGYFLNKNVYRNLCTDSKHVKGLEGFGHNKNVVRFEQQFQGLPNLVDKWQQGVSEKEKYLLYLRRKVGG